MTWWASLGALNQIFYGVAAFFSTLFLWQFVAALLGLSGSVDGVGSDDVSAGDAGPEVDDSFHDHGGATFKLLSVRALIAFGMLFGWAGGLYLEEGVPLEDALARAFVWGSAGLILVAFFFYKVQQLSESGNRKLTSCVGHEGEVYIGIPQDGTGQIRVLESGAVNYVSARGIDGVAIANKTPVRVLRTIDLTTVEVEPVQS